MSSHRHSPDSQNDSDDWTLVSPQPSPSSSPERRNFLLNQSRSTQTSQSGSDSSLENILDDGLTEIELNDNFNDHNQHTLETNLTCATAYQAREETGGSSSTESIPGFQPIDTTTDEELSSNSSRRSSLTQSQLNEYVDFGGKFQDSDSITVTSQINNLDTSVVACNRANIEFNSQQEQQSTSNRLGEQPTRPRSDQQLDDVNGNNNRRMGVTPLRLLYLYSSVLIIAIIFNHFFPRREYFKNDIQSRNRRYREEVQNNFKWANSIPPSQLAELQLLDHELSQCVQRQSPSSFKYYMSEEPLYNSKRDVSETIKAHRGLFCYGQEAKWRNRFDRLRLEYNLDLRKMVDEAKKHVTTEMLGTINPALDFKLILNQLEYLDFLESRRNKKQSEETIKHLMAENLQLLHRLNQPNETGYQKIVVELELRNSKLQRENEALKAKFIEKAGPVYIKQSMELERLESENVVLKQFLQQIGKDVSQSLRQFNLHTVDTSTILDDRKSLNAQLMLTKGYMRRLSEKISTVLIENEGLKEELKELYQSLSTATNNLPVAHNGEMNNNHAVDARDKNDSNALMADTCMRSLYELREKSAHLEEENQRLKIDCYKSSDIERSTDRNLNRTDEGTEHYSIEEQFISKNWRRIGSLDTTVDKRIKDRLTLRNDDTFLDELMVFLTKFNNHAESNELAKIKHLGEENQEAGESFQIVEQPLQSGNKVIPNYIREAIRSGGMNEMRHDLGVLSERSSIKEDSAFANKFKPPPPQINIDFLESRSNESDQAYNVGSIPSEGNENSLLEEEESKKIEDQLQQKSGTQNNSDDLVTPCWQSHKSSNFPLPDSVATNEQNEDPHNASSENLARDTWFFKRAKQRRQLRHSDTKVDSKTNDWAMKRAKLRAKLRTASSYIEYHHQRKDYTFGRNGKYSQDRRYTNNRLSNIDKKQKKHQQKQGNHNKYFRDEL